MTSWFRSWHGAPTDTKWLAIARRAGVAPGVVSAVAWALLDYASQHNERGTVDGFDVESYAAFSGFDDSDVTSVILALTDKGTIDNGRWVSWEKQQAGSSLRPSPEVWKKIRVTIFARDDYTCQYCGVHGVTLECDHVTPVSRGGSNDISNLVTACKKCNQSKRDKTPEEWKR